MSGEGRRPGVSRRRFLSGLGVVGAGAAIAGAAFAVSESRSGDESPAASGIVAFHGRHQAGIITPVQDRLLFGSFDVVTDSRDDLVALLKAWTDASARMAAGDLASAEPDQAAAPPADTGEAMGLAATRLTVTFGFGPGLFEKDGVDRFGIAARRPAALVDLPAFALDALNPLTSDGDIGVQVCADDPQVAFHALRNLARIGRGTVLLRWSQAGFGRTSSTSTAQETMRNLQGFKDGTNNLKAEDGALMDEHVWVGETDDPAWMRGGSYVVTRRIRMFIEVWDRSSLADQEVTIGRAKVSGAPLGGTAEFDPPDLGAVDADGSPVIAANAHIRLASPDENAGARLLRRGFSFTDGIDPRTGQLDAGLFFIAYQRDPRAQFIPLQQRLGLSDLLNEYIQHTGSAIFAVPPGIEPGGWIGETLFG